MIISGVTLLIACTVFVVSDYLTTRSRLVRDISMLADIAVLASDVFARPPRTATDVVVQATVFDGRVVYERKTGR